MSVWIVETLIATSLLMALVMLLRRPVARWLGAGAAYSLWVLPLLRMVLPVLPQEVAAPSPLHIAVDQSGLPGLLALSNNPQAASESGFPWLEAGIALWFIGLLAFLLFQAVGYIRFRRHMLDGSVLLGQEGRIRTIASPQASGPLAFGVLRPMIVLPLDFAQRYDDLEQEMAVAHERAHHERGDLLAAGRCHPLKIPPQLRSGDALWREADAAASLEGPRGIAATHIVADLPPVDDPARWAWLVETFAFRHLVDKGMIVDWAVHARRDAEGGWIGTPHVHLLATARFWRPGGRHGARHWQWFANAGQTRAVEDAWLQFVGARATAC